MCLPTGPSSLTITVTRAYKWRLSPCLTGAIMFINRVLEIRNNNFSSNKISNSHCNILLNLWTVFGYLFSNLHVLKLNQCHDPVNSIQ